MLSPAQITPIRTSIHCINIMVTSSLCHFLPAVDLTSAIERLPTPEGRFTLTFSDEFDGERIDLGKWSILDIDRHDGRWSPQAVEVDGKGLLHLKTIAVDGKYISGNIRSEGNLSRPLVTSPLESAFSVNLATGAHFGCSQKTSKRSKTTVSTALKLTSWKNRGSTMWYSKHCTGTAMENIIEVQEGPSSPTELWMDSTPTASGGKRMNIYSSLMA